VGTVVPIVGWIAWIFAYIGFNKLKSATAPTHFYQTQYSTTPAHTKSCPNCGTENPPTPITASHVANPYNNANLSINHPSNIQLHKKSYI